MKKGFTIIEIAFVLLLIFGVAFFVIPMSIDDTNQAKFVESWQESYSNTTYMFSVIAAEQDEKMENIFRKGKDENLKSNFLINLIKEHLRIAKSVELSKYKPRYLDKTMVKENDLYYFTNLFLANNGKIVGVKWLQNVDDERPYAILMFDINGMDAPNMWGKDIFGIDIYKDRISPFGKDRDMVVLKSNCSKTGLGTYCSYYYLYGGSFN